MRDRHSTLSTIRAFIADIEQTGSLELRNERGRKPAYCIRFRYRCPSTGTVRQRRLIIGDDPELHDVVRTAIRSRILRRLQDKAAKTAAAKRRKRERADEAEFMAGHPGSRRRRQHVRQAYRRSIVSGQHFVVELYRLLASLPRRKRPGRPFKSRLW